jgi:putative transposase
VFQNRYKSILCQEDVYFKELVRYIHLNPIRAKIIRGIPELNKYPWSGHSVLMGKKSYGFQNKDAVLILFGNEEKESRKRYIKFIIDGINMGHRKDLTGGGLLRSAGGWAGVRLLRKMKDFWNRDERILGDGNFVSEVLKISEEEMEKSEKLLQAGWTLEKIIEYICLKMNIEAKDLTKKGRNNAISKAKACIFTLSKDILGMNGNEIGKYFNCTKQAVSMNILKGREIIKQDNICLN